MAADDQRVAEPFGPGGAHVVLAQDLEDVGAHEAADHAHGNQRQRDHRQDHVPELRPRPRKSRGPHALGGQHVPDDGEDRDEDDPDPVVRQAHARDGGRREDPVEDRAPVERGEGAEYGAEDEAQERGRNRQHERVAERAEQLAGDGHVGDD